MVLPTGNSRRSIVRVGNMVVWRYRYEMDLPSEVGITIEKFKAPGDPFPHWKVLFPDRGILHCRESDLQEVE
jgi:hypothetical protein